MPHAENNMGRIGWYDQYGNRFKSYNALKHMERLYEMAFLLNQIKSK